MTRIEDEQRRGLRTLTGMVDLRGCRVLDVGCGDGQLTLLVAELAASVVGVDRDATAIERASRAAAAPATFIAEDITSLDRPWRHAFDVVVFSRSL